MLKRVEIKNYQSHKHTVVDFVPGVNAIVGLSTTGKTAILRAVNWVINNDPLGGSFQSHWGGETEVTLEFSDGNIITKKRCNETNIIEHVLHNDIFCDAANHSPSNSRNIFSAFGTNNPESIQQILNFSEINFAQQQEGPFLILSSGGEVAKTLNRFANLEIIDVATSNINKKVLGLNSDLRVENKRLSEVQNELEQFQFLEELEEKVTELEQKELQHKAITESISTLSRLISNGTVLKKQRRELRQITRHKTKIQEVEQNIKELKELQQKVSVLEGTLLLINKTQTFRNQLPQFDSEVVNQIRAVEEQQAQLKDLEQQTMQLKDLYIKIDRTQKTITGLQEELETQKQQYQEQFPEICPLCDK